MGYFLRAMIRIGGACMLTLSSVLANADVVVIVHPKNSASNLSAEQISALYLGSATTFPDGTGVTLTDQLESTSIRNDFYQRVTGRSVAQVKATWARL
jgi:hypothetical protein